MPFGVASALDPYTVRYSHSMERIIYYCQCCQFMGSPVDEIQNLFHCDNHAVVDIWHKGSTCDSAIMALVHLLYFCAACYHINIVITHIPGTDNCIADSLSCFQNQRFHHLVRSALPTADIIRAWPTTSFLHPCSSFANSVQPHPPDVLMALISTLSFSSVTNTRSLLTLLQALHSSTSVPTWHKPSLIRQLRFIW